MAYNNSSDAQVYVLGSEITFSDTDANSIAAFVEAQRIIRGRLAKEIDSATLATWDSPPTSTQTAPDEIRHIAGKLSAALMWRPAVASDDGDVNKTYGQKLYDEALAELEMILSGQIIIEGVTLTGGTQNLDSDLLFYPNDSTIGQPDDIKFTMGRRF